MILVEIAAVILFIALFVYIAIHALWILFFLFTFRFWEAVLPYEWLSHYIAFDKELYYHLTMLILTLITYVVVRFATQSVPFLHYIFLFFVASFTLFKYDFYEILFFKDFLEAKGMWGWEFWIGEVKALFTSDPSRVWDAIKSMFQALWNFVEGIISWVRPQ